MKAFFKKTKSETGQSMIIFALAIVVILGMAALVLDFGRVKIAQSRMQSAADAAVYAAAENLPDVTNATNVALAYGEVNGADPTRITIVTPYNGNADEIEVTCSKVVEYSFAKVLGFDQTVASARAVAKKGTAASDAFKYAVFTGSPSKQARIGAEGYVNGDFHSNNDIFMHGNKIHVTGDVEAVYNATLSGGNKSQFDGTVQAANIIQHNPNISTGSKVLVAAPFIDMPDLSDIINAAKANADQTYFGWTQIGGSNVTIDDSIFVDGDLQINGSNVTINGAIMATGNISIHGSNVTLTGKDGLSLYSANGNIQLTGSSPVIHGMVYAPKGNFQSSAKLTVHGQIIVDSLQMDGADISIIYDDEHLNTLGLSGGDTALIE